MIYIICINWREGSKILASIVYLILERLQFFSPQPLDLIRNFLGKIIFYLLIRMVGKGKAGKKIEEGRGRWNP
jgi:hypothetical protein